MVMKWIGNQFDSPHKEIIQQGLPIPKWHPTPNTAKATPGPGWQRIQSLVKGLLIVWSELLFGVSLEIHGIVLASLVLLTWLAAIKATAEMMVLLW